jgi:hypothetical protein
MVYNKSRSYNKPAVSFFLRGEGEIRIILFASNQSPSSNVPEVSVRGVQKERGTPVQRRINVLGSSGGRVPDKLVAARRAASQVAEKMGCYW